MLGDFLFWLHIFIIVFSVLSGLWLPTLLVLAFAVLHKTHLIVLGDCLLTRFKKYTKTIKEDEVFLQYAMKRLLKVVISKRESELINYSIYALAVFLSLVH